MIAIGIQDASGHPPQVMDTLLNATAIEHALSLATRNAASARSK
jgi:predicted nucleic acid-binding protein